jgi:hypothetical protein
MKAYIAWVGVLVWMFFSLFYLFSIKPASSKIFDSSETLLKASLDEGFDRFVEEEVTSLVGGVKNKVVHIVDMTCGCQMSVMKHKSKVVELAREHEFQNSDIEYAALPDDLKSALTTVPAVMVFNEQGRMTYLGPYGKGTGCLPTNGIVDSFIRRENHYGGGAVIPFEEEGCYCYRG